jgi:hypothetical protein
MNIEEFKKDLSQIQKADFGDFSEYEARCFIAEYCKEITIGSVGWGVSFIDWIEFKGIAKHEKMFRLIKIN